MVAPRAVWKGFLKFGAVACGIKLINAGATKRSISASLTARTGCRSSPPISTRSTRATSNRAEDQIKGYQLDNGDYLLIEPEDMKALKQTTEHTLEVEETIDLSLDRPALSRQALLCGARRRDVEGAVRGDPRGACEKKAAARASIVLYQRGREVVLRPHGEGLMMTTLRNAKEVVSEKSIFDGIKVPKTDPEMVEIASLLIDKKVGKFDPSISRTATRTR